MARESAGDPAGACLAYQRVLDRWGSATPRSTTADLARARMRPLQCAAEGYDGGTREAMMGAVRRRVEGLLRDPRDWRFIPLALKR